MVNSLIAIAAGATLGAWSRWGLELWLNPLKRELSLGTLAANLAGAYMIGLAIAWLTAHPSLSPQWRLFVITGLLGGLTTFSTFSAQTIALFERGQFGWASLLVGLHVFGSLAMTALGLGTMRALRVVGG